MIQTEAQAYRDQEPFYTVEQEQIETFGPAIANGQYGWRDVVWIVQWYYRRYLGAYPDDHRREIEETFAENEFEAIRDRLSEVIASSEVSEQVGLLTQLNGVDVGLASAFLMYIEPEERITIGPREWSALVNHSELERSPPEPFEPADYSSYLQTCREIGTRTDSTMWTVYQALWRLGDQDAL